MRETLIIWTCPTCNKDTEVTCTQGVPAQTYGPPEKCYPGEGPGIDPENCLNCDAPIDIGTALQEAADCIEADRAYYEELREPDLDHL